MKNFNCLPEAEKIDPLESFPHRGFNILTGCIIKCAVCGLKKQTRLPVPLGNTRISLSIGTATSEPSLCILIVAACIN